MKLFCVFLSFFVIYISIDCCEVFYEDKTCNKIDNICFENNDKEDLCSDFCLCFCCSNTTINISIKQPSISKNLIFQSKIFSYIAFLNKGFINKLLQPPRL